MTPRPPIKPETQRVLDKANDMKAWLLTKPPEVTAVMGLRTALRTLPFVLSGTPDGQFEKKERHRVVMAFRYLALAKLCVTSHPVSFYHACTALNTVGHRTGTSVTATIIEGCRAAVSLCSPNGRSPTSHSSMALRANYSLRIASFIFTPIDWQLPWREAEVDKAWINAGGSATDLLRKRLWLEQEPFNNLPEPHLTAWNALRQVLEEDDPSWKVWISWYEDRLSGKLADPEEIELFRITLIPDAHLKARDSSKQGELLWKQELEAKHKVLRNDTRKSNRLIETFIADWHAQARNASPPTAGHISTSTNERGEWRNGWLHKLFGGKDE